MDPTEIPPPSSVWSTEQSLFPQVDVTTISQYTGFKRIFNSSKIKTVKVHRNGEVTFVKTKDQSSGCTRIQKLFPLFSLFSTSHCSGMFLSDIFPG